MQLFLYRKSRKGLLGSSSEAAVPDFKLRRSEKMPSSNFLEFLTGRPKAWNLNERHRTMSVPEMWKRLFQRPHETYSPVGSRNLRMYWSGCQSTGAEMRKYFTARPQVGQRLRRRAKGSMGRGGEGNIRLSTCCRAT